MTTHRYAAVLVTAALVTLAKGTGAGAHTMPEFALPAIAGPVLQRPARLIVRQPLPDALARGLVVIQYRTENLRIVPVYGKAARAVSPRIGHLHITLDGAAWHWVDASGEPVIVQFLPAGRHRVLIELADPTHHVIDRATVTFTVPAKHAGVNR